MSVRRLLVILGAAAAVVFLLRGFGRAREDVDWEDAERPGRIVDVDGVAVHYVERGSGPAVVLLHGFGGHTFSFRHTIPALAQEYRVVAPDLKGFGYSQRPSSGDYSQSAQARLVIGLMDRLGIDQATLVGHSMGGAVAARVACAWPERIDRLILVASAPGERFFGPLLGAMRLLRPVLPLLARLTARRLLRASVHDPAFVTAEVREGYGAPMRIRGSMDGLYRMMRAAGRDAPIDFRKIAHPVLLIWAGDDRVVPPWMLAQLRRRLPRAELVTVQNAGHLLLEERPEECNSVIQRFLRGAAVAPTVQGEAGGSVGG